MRKQVLSLVALLAITFSLKAQTSGGPDAYGYNWRNNSDPNGPTYNWIDIKGRPGTVQVTTLTDDNLSGAINLPVPFHYYWYDVNKMYIGSNGYISFSATTILSAGNPVLFPVIPTPGGGGENYIGAFVADLICNAGQGQVYYSFSPGNDSMIVTFDSIPFWDPNTANSASGANTFQVILSNVDSSITIQYKDQVGTYQGGTPGSNTGEISLGIENNSGSIGLQYLYGIYPTAGSSVKYYYPATTTLAISDASTSYNDNPENGGIFLSKNGGAYFLKTQVANTGNQSLTTFNVKSEIRSASNILQVTNTSATGPLAPGQTQLINQPNPFTPTTAGAFFFRTDTQLPGDATPSNNRKDVEIEVVDTTLASIELAYENATVNTATYGLGGGAVYMKPPFAPYIMNTVKSFLIGGTTSGGSVMVYDDNGPNGAPLTLLDSVYVASGSFTTTTWVSTTLTSPILKTSGGFYLLFIPDVPANLTLGVVATAPISSRTYEVITGSSPSDFAPYRDRATNELMMRAVISKVVGVKELNKGEFFGELYPNPSTNGKIFMSYDLTSAGSIAFTVNVYNTSGQLVQQKAVSSTKGTLDLNVSNLNAGIYVCKISNGNSEVERKFTIIK